MVLVELLLHRPGSLKSLPALVGADTVIELLIVDSCLQTKLEGGLIILHDADQDAEFCGDCSTHK